eukprot:scaffold12020_cov122-Isochrysis_galbana.AAC.16
MISALTPVARLHPFARGRGAKPCAVWQLSIDSHYFNSAFPKKPPMHAADALMCAPNTVVPLVNL